MSALNPSAQEWKPVCPNPLSPPPCAAVPAVAFVAPPHHNPTFYFLGFVPFPQLLPYQEMSTAAPPPMYGGEEKKMGFPATAKKSWFSPGGRVKAAPRHRLEWRPKNAVAGGATSSPPPQDLPESDGRELTWRTTVMIRNVPNQLRRNGMLKFLDDCCKKLSLEYNFLYLPMDFRSEVNLGYAFVNFTDAKSAVKFQKSLNNQEWGLIKTPKGKYKTYKICEVTWAAIQGKEGLMKKFENSIFGCDNSDFLPVEFDPPRNGFNGHLSPPKVVGKLRRQS